MTKTLIKEALRSITANKLRFLSVAVIIALGMSFFVGINSASPGIKDQSIKPKTPPKPAPESPLFD